MGSPILRGTDEHKAAKQRLDEIAVEITAARERVASAERRLQALRDEQRELNARVYHA